MCVRVLFSVVVWFRACVRLTSPFCVVCVSCIVSLCFVFSCCLFSASLIGSGSGCIVARCLVLRLVLLPGAAETYQPLNNVCNVGFRFGRFVRFSLVLFKLRVEPCVATFEVRVFSLKKNCKIMSNQIKTDKTQTHAAKTKDKTTYKPPKNHTKSHIRRQTQTQNFERMAMRSFESPSTLRRARVKNTRAFVQ